MVMARVEMMANKIIIVATLTSGSVLDSGSGANSVTVDVGTGVLSVVGREGPAGPPLAVTLMFAVEDIVLLLLSVNWGDQNSSSAPKKTQPAALHRQRLTIDFYPTP